MIAKHSIDQVIETAQVEEVVGHFVNLKRRGINMIGLCPFHDEKTPSFTVSPSKNIYKCFGCGKGGGAVNFVMEHEGYSFVEAIRYLAKMYNITIEETEQSPEETQQALKKDSLYIVMEFSKEHFINNLFNTQAGVNIGLSYFKERGFREQTIREFELGFAPDDFNDLTEVALRKQYKKEYLTELGLSAASGRDFFRNRVIFPIHNLSGKPIGFGGRTLTKDPKVPKYINSPESDIYNKRKSLYALYFAKNHIRKHDECILVEGYTDVISLHQAGIKNVVASSGTALTEDQVRLIKRYTQNVLVIYDGDPAGINAAMRGLELILSQNMYVKIITLPENHDPDSYLKAVGPAAFTQFLSENASDFILFKSRILDDTSKRDPVQKVKVLKEMVQTLAKVPDPLARSTYIKECSRILNVEEHILVNETNKKIKSEIRQKRFREEIASNRRNDMSIEDAAELTQKQTDNQKQLFSSTSDQHLERELIRILINHAGKVYDETNMVMVVDFLTEQCAELIPYFENDLYARIFAEVVQIRQSGGDIQTPYFLNHEDNDIQNIAIDLLSFPYEYANWSEKGMELQTQKIPEDNFIFESNQISIRLNYRKLEKIIAENLEKLKKLSIDSEDYLLTLKVHQKLLEERKHFATLLNNVIS
jgi:DNA primase